MFRGAASRAVCPSRPLSFTNNDLHHTLDAVLSARIRSSAAADPGSLLLHRRPLSKVLLRGAPQGHPGSW
jgi:hypothetical protein